MVNFKEILEIIILILKIVYWVLVISALPGISFLTKHENGKNSEPSPPADNESFHKNRL